MNDKKIEVTAIFPIYKPFRKINKSFKNSIEKILGKLNSWFRPKYKPVTEELNQFVFSTTITENQKYLDYNERKKIEKKLIDIYEKFEGKILDQLESIFKNDPEFKISYSALKEAHDNLDLDIEKRITNLDSLAKEVRIQISQLFMDSLLLIWDLPGEHVDRIIIGHEVIDRKNDSIKVVDISMIADELALAALGKHHIPLLCNQVELIFDQIKYLSPKIDEFETGFKSIKNDEEKRILVDIASILLGKLLGIREPLLLAKLQLERYLQLEEEIATEAKKIGSDFLNTLYRRIIDHEKIIEAKSLIDDIQEGISADADNIRKLYTYIEQAEPVGKSSHLLSEFVDFVAKIYYNLEDFRFITETFQDIPSYTSLGGGVAIESEDEEEIEIPEGYAIWGENIFKTFPLPTTTVYAIRGIDIKVKDGEFLAIMGPSGSGKTTLLNILSGLDDADRGIINVSGLDLNHATEKQLVRFRRDKVAFIYQSYNLLPNLKNVENVQLPADLGTKKDLGNHHDRAVSLLEEVGIGEYTDGYPLRLSGGQQQRVTIARALMNKPDIIFADEPTGDLDSVTGGIIMDIIEQFHKEGVTIVLVTHDKKIANRAERIIRMRDGKIIEE